jgi:hypothetical protein
MPGIAKPTIFDDIPTKRPLSLPKMLFGANAFEISNIQEVETERC